MSWNPQGGGPWGGGGNNGGGRGNNPWGGGGGQGGGPNPPDIEEMLRKSQDKFKRMMPSGGTGGSRVIILVVLVLVAGWMLTGFYTVKPGHQGVELLFGKFVKTTNPGLNYWPPAPIGEVNKVNINVTQTTSVGFSTAGASNNRGVDRPEESLMITGDQNIIDMDFVVQWNIKSVSDYLFNILDPESSVKIAAESAMREIVGRTPLEGTLTQLRGEVQDQAKNLLQVILDSYGSGINIIDVKLQKVDPPQPVIDAFNDVQRAKQDQERSINEAQAYANDIIPRAKGEAQRMIQGASAYKERVIAEAEGDAQRFLSVYSAYTLNKDVTTRRMYLETMRDILGSTNKIIIDQGGANGQGVVPYLPLNELQRGNAQGGR